MKKRFVLCIAIVFLVSGVLNIALGTQGDTSSIARVTTQKGVLNLRSRPQADAAVLKYIPNGTVITVLSRGDVYWEVIYDNTQGYVMASFLTLVDGQGNPLESDQARSEDITPRQDTRQGLPVAQVTTEVGPLNLRSHPQSGAAVLVYIPNRSYVSVIAQGDVFWEICYGEYRGYAVHDFLTMTAYTEAILQYQVLYRGNAGDDVLALKERLLELGYYREGSTMNNNYNNTCVDRLMMFQRQNGLREDGIATAETQAALFADTAAANTEELPAVPSGGYIVASSSDPANGIDENFDWDQWMLNNPGVCPCCFGSGCTCCNFTGQI